MNRTLFQGASASAIPALALVLLSSPAAFAADKVPVKEHVAELLRNVQPTRPGVALDEPPRTSLTRDGYLSYLGAPPSHHFPVANAVPGAPELTARNFLRDHALPFGASSPFVDFAHLKTKKKADRHYVRFQQTLAGVPVFAAQVVVQIGALNGVECVLSDIERNTKVVEEGALPLNATVTAEQALSIVEQFIETKGPNLPAKFTQPELTVFAPSVLGAPGEVRLAWKIDVSSDAMLSLNKRFLIDAHSGQVVRDYPRSVGALTRHIYNANNTDSNGTLARSEGNPDTGITDVDAAYEHFETTYWYYRHGHGRDSFNGDGCSLEVTVNYCGFDQANPCANAMYRSVTSSDCKADRFYFGPGFVAQDVVAHEYTHGVTDHESDLVYENESGAISESLSDCWGEFVDLSYSSPFSVDNDHQTNRWILMEDLPGSKRNMRDPPNAERYPGASSCPDRKYSPLYVPSVSDPNSENDYGGVHRNCGVNNKLCYLITDGAYWNNQNTFGMGIERVADLYYEANANLLSSGAGWWNLYDALTQAAVNLGWNTLERNNLYRACVAVEIDRDPRQIWVSSGACEWQTGDPFCMETGDVGPYHGIARGINKARPGDHLHIWSGTYNETLILDKMMTVTAENGIVTIRP